jgi:hypothetical protein
MVEDRRIALMSFSWRLPVQENTASASGENGGGAGDAAGGGGGGGGGLLRRAVYRFLEIEDVRSATEKDPKEPQYGGSKILRESLHPKHANQVGAARAYRAPRRVSRHLSRPPPARSLSHSHTTGRPLPRASRRRFFPHCAARPDRRLSSRWPTAQST